MSIKEVIEGYQRVQKELERIALKADNEAHKIEATKQLENVKKQLAKLQDIPDKTRPI